MFQLQVVQFIEVLDPIYPLILQLFRPSRSRLSRWSRMLLEVTFVLGGATQSFSTLKWLKGESIAGNFLKNGIFVVDFWIWFWILVVDHVELGIWRIEKKTSIQMLLPEIDVLMSCFMMQQKHKSFEKKGVNISMLALQHALFWSKSALNSSLIG